MTAARRDRLLLALLALCWAACACGPAQNDVVANVTLKSEQDAGAMNDGDVPSGTGGVGDPCKLPDGVSNLSVVANMDCVLNADDPLVQAVMAYYTNAHIPAPMFNENQPPQACEFGWPYPYAQLPGTPVRYKLCDYVCAAIKKSVNDSYKKQTDCRMHMSASSGM